MNNFYDNIISESKSTVISRLVFILLLIVVLLVPYFINITDGILDVKYQNSFFPVLFMSAIIWIGAGIAWFILGRILWIAVKSVIWIFTGDWPSFEMDDIWENFGKHIMSPFVFIFNFLFCTNDYKTLLIKNIFKKKNEKAKDLLNS